MGKLEKYSSYKDSEINWLGNLPSHWKLVRIKHLFKISKKYSTDKKPNVLSLTQKGIVERDISTNEGQLAQSYVGYNIIEKDDIVFNPMDLIAGYVAKSIYNGVISHAYTTLKSLKKIDLDFYEHYFQNWYHQGVLFHLGKGVSTDNRWTLNNNSLMNLVIPIVPIGESNKIVNYINAKTVQINNVINKKEKLIELLKERKQIVINDAVTKGLDKNVEFVDSNLKDFGYIPKHWKIMFNRRLFREENRKKFNKMELPLSLSQVDGVIPSGEMKERSLSPSHRDNFKLCLPDDLVVNRFKGHLGVFFKSDFRGIITFHYGVFKPSNFVNTKYYEYLFHTQYYKNIYAGASNGMTIGLQNLSNQNFYDVKSIVPPIEEQNEIVNFIEKEETKINKTIQFQVEIITKLKEYKASLIDSVVTGKVRVV
ncbi:MAG: restriction endonuclease subunit S [Arcobacter sp.]|uniref:restriction endonuclease subunit S n=1 Tax=Arcobacter sp. TaxID=1872629 RepID=UPI003D08DB84